MRKPIQIAISEHQGGVALTALCDDGTMWDLNSGQWIELPAIPQDESKDPLAVAVGKLNDIETVALALRYPSPGEFNSGTAALEYYGGRLTDILKG